MNIPAALIAFTFLTSSTFNLQSYSNYEMKIYKKSSIEKIAPPTVEEPKFGPLFEEWKTIIQKHSRDRLYEHTTKDKKRK